jgi:hypothetical protein
MVGLASTFEVIGAFCGVLGGKAYGMNLGHGIKFYLLETE